MTREPRWLVHRSEEALTVRVGSFYTPTTYRVPLASEPELRSWFRRRRWQGWAAALPLVIVSTIAAMWIGSGIVLWIAGVAVGWSILVETTSMRFERAFPVARLLHQKRGANAIFGIEPDGSAVVLPSGTFKTYRLNAEDAARFLIWRRRMLWYGMPLLPPGLAYLLARLLELTWDATIGILWTVTLASVGASVPWLGWRFRREFPAAVQVEMPAQPRFIASLSEQWLWKPTGLIIQGALYLLLGLVLWQQFRSIGLAIGFGGYFMAAWLLLFAGILVRVVLYRMRRR